MAEPVPTKAPKLPEVESDNVVKEEQAKGDVRPDGPGDESAPVEPEPSDGARRGVPRRHD